MTALALPEGAERLGLRRYLQRLLGLDRAAAVRLQADGGVLGVWGGPPLDVLTLRPVALAGPALVDATVSAQRLLDGLDDGGDLGVPQSVPGPVWAGWLPPRIGWELVGEVPAAEVLDAVRVGVEAFRRRVDPVAPPLRTAELLESVAAEVWERPVVGGAPLRAAHAAELVGLLGPDGQVTAYRSEAWWRIRCAGGSVLGRTGDRPMVAIDLFALTTAHDRPLPG